MRLLRAVGTAAIAVLTLTSCTNQIIGSPQAPQDSTDPYVEAGSFDESSAAEVLLTEDDLPDPAYLRFPDAELNGILKDLVVELSSGELDVSPESIDPPHCASSFDDATLSVITDYLDLVAARAFYSGSTPADIELIVEVIGPPAVIGTSVDLLAIPEGCEEIVATTKDETVTMTMTQLPIDIGASSSAIEFVTDLGPDLAEDGVESVTIQLAIVSESEGGLAIMTMNNPDVIELTQLAYDKAEEFLK